MIERPKLRALAEHCSILSGFHDWRGHWCEPDDDTRVSLLAGMGVDASSEALAEAALASLTTEDSLECGIALLSPDDGRIDLAGPQGATVDFDGELVLRRDDGDEIVVAVSCEARASGVVLRIDPARPPAFGYYDAELRHGRAVAGRWFLLAPPARTTSVRDRCGDARALGVMVNLYTLRTVENWGVGDFGDLRRAAERLAGMGVGFLGSSPLHATGNRGSGTSPYYPSTRRFVNPLYIDVTGISGHATGSTLRALLSSPAFRERLEHARESERLAHREVLALKLTALEAAYADRTAEARSACEAYSRREGDDLERFAIYETLAEELSRESPGEPDWRSWPAPFRCPESAETRDLAERRSERVAFHRWLQWEADRQLAAAGAALGLGLFLDLAVGTAPGGAETWANRNAFASEVELGCPPDDYSSTGQCWGLAPLLPRVLRRTQYSHLRRVLAASFRHAGALRIDHAMGFVRQFWVPSGEPASRGAYVALPAAETLAVLAIESAKAQSVVVAEDLGTVPQDFRDQIGRRGFLRTQVLYFERRDDGEYRGASEYAAEAFVSANNHDLPPLAGFACGVDLVARADSGRLPSGQTIEEALRERTTAATALRRRLAAEGVLDEGAAEGENLLAATTLFLARTPAALVAVTLDDLGGEEDPVNVPGLAATDRPQWSRRMRRTVDEILTDRQSSELLRETAGAVTGKVVMPIDGCLDLHAFRPAEIAPLLTDYVAECRRRGLLEIRVVHGKGQGVLRRSVEALLPRIPGVASWRDGRADEGSWGATMVSLHPIVEEDESK